MTDSQDAAKPVHLRSVSTVYIVATPIGNLGDITLRALETLKKVEVVACEDTRRTRKLLTHFGISVRLLSVRARNEESAAVGVYEVLERGGDVAYVSDAGTPGVSDPGSVLVRGARERGFPVVPLPGPSAVAALMSVSGFGGKSVLFDGFLSPKPGRRRRRLAELLEREEGFCVYESPYRTIKLLREIADIEPERHLIVGREMTKAFEEFIEGTAAETASLFENRGEIKGEVSVLVSGKKIG